MFSVLASLVSECDKLMHLTKIQNSTQGSSPLTLFLYFSSILLILSVFLPPANEVWGKVIFLHPFVILFMGGGHVWSLPVGGACMVALGGGMYGCPRGAYMVAMGGHAWLLGGACMVAPGGHACLLLRWGMHACSEEGVHGCSGGGHVWLLRGGMHGCSWGACMVAPRGHAWLLPGGMHGIRRDTEIRSMSGR